jgi:hypothetical protein
MDDYAVTWDIYYRTAASDFTKRYTTHYLEEMQAEGANALFVFERFLGFSDSC